ncbi:TPA: cellulase family glycosylhydrolase [Candidatus Woesearchaeota archaeon]|nr:hypothetical protein QT06_C0001G0664 [archaeon GW2011_AR15]MBS3103549.1 cellulase family glycosylhydrolase [Candidatus Woesearchaeota archaeon]HIH41347.1 cellulase family glycosylhydrolase [Candidatus Woesearchaeota archaeon]
MPYKNMNRWSSEKANNWYKKQGWIAGINFIPSNAVNQLEMWQQETFDQKTIDRELGYAEKLGFNAARVFLHNLLWEQDPEGFVKRIEAYLKIADKRGIKTMFVLLDGVWNPFPRLGKQPEPLPYIHNSGWVQSAGAEYLRDESRHPLIESYVKGIVKHFADDRRILMWDIFNEPNNPNRGYIGKEIVNKEKAAFRLLAKAFSWARDAKPSQPITAGVWGSMLFGIIWKKRINQFMLANSDAITFHSYRSAGKLEKEILYLKKFKRPVICTEYMGRPYSTFETCMPVFKKHNTGCFSWGLVSGKTQTIYPWSSWALRQKKEPTVWFHDILRKDGTAFNEKEVEFIKNFTKKTSHHII